MSVRGKEKLKIEDCIFIPIWKIMWVNQSRQIGGKQQFVFVGFGTYWERVRRFRQFCRRHEYFIFLDFASESETVLDNEHDRRFI